MTGKPPTKGTSGMKYSKTAGSAVGRRNSQFGTCWVTNGIPIKIKQDQLQTFLAMGYVRGRIMGLKL